MDSATESLSVRGSVGAGWDSNSVTDIPETTTDGSGTAVSEPRGAGYNLFSGSLAYTKSGQRLNFSASSATSGRYYKSLSEPFLASHSARVGLGYQSGRSTSFNAAQTVSYQPFGTLNVFPSLTNPVSVGPEPLDVVAAPSLDVRALRRTYTSATSDAGVTRRLSRRSSVSASYSFRTSQFEDEAGSFHAQSVSAGFNRVITEHLGLRLGYGYTESRLAQTEERFHNHFIDSGINYNRALSISRRTTVSFDTGGTGVNDGQATRWDVLGGANLVHEIGRTWALMAAYRRNVQFVETLRRPLFSDSVNSSLKGLLSRRVQFSAGAGASSSSFGVKRAAKGLWSYYANASVGVAVSRHLQISGQYSYYQYRFDDPVYQTLGFNQQVNRHGVSVSLDAWAPIFQKGRGTNASR